MMASINDYGFRPESKGFVGLLEGVCVSGSFGYPPHLHPFSQSLLTPTLVSGRSEGMSDKMKHRKPISSAGMDLTPSMVATVCKK